MTEGKGKPSPSRSLGEAAYAELLPELEALETELLDLNVDVQTIVATALGCLPRLRRLQPRFEAIFVQFKPAQFDRLTKLAWCLRHAHTLYLAASRATEVSPEMLKEGTLLRRAMLEDAEMLAKRRLVDESRLCKLIYRKGYQNVGADLGILMNVLRDSWAQVEGRCSVTARDIERAGELWELLASVDGRREKQVEAVARAADKRLRAFNLFVQEYDELRDAVIYLRRKKRDSEKIMPSLFAGRGGRGKAKAGSPSAPSETTQGGAKPDTTHSPSDDDTATLN